MCVHMETDTRDRKRMEGNTPQCEWWLHPSGEITLGVFFGYTLLYLPIFHSEYDTLL